MYACLQMSWRLAIAIALLLPALSATAATSGPLRCKSYDPTVLHAPYVFNYGLTSSQLQTSYYGDANKADDGSHADAGYRPVRLTGYVHAGEVRYATKWVKDGAGAWSSGFGLTGAAFHARYLDLKSRGFRIIDASAYVTAAGVRYADIWLQNTAGVGWAVTRNVPAAQMPALEADMRALGYAPTRVEGYSLGLNTAYIITWETSGCEWALEEGLSAAQYQLFFDASIATMRPIHVDAYMAGSNLQYASIFWRQAGPPIRATHGQHWYRYQAALNKGACDGYVPETFYGVEVPGGWDTFGGIWSNNGAPVVNAGSSASVRITHQVNCAQGRAGAAFINTTTGETVVAHADQIFGSASAIKITVLYGLLRKADADSINMDSKSIDGVSLATLATQMIVNSNNTSTNTLIDYVGRTNINDQLAALGLKVVRVNRYLTGGPSAYGLGSWFDDFKAGYDNFVTPRELATLWRLLYENKGLLSAQSYARFRSITDAAPSLMNDVLPAGYDPYYVEINAKAGGKSYPGVPGDFAHRPQLGAHKIASEGGALVFSNGQTVFYAAIVDEAAPAASVAAIACTGWEAAKTWAAAGSDEADGAGFCGYP